MLCEFFEYRDKITLPDNKNFQNSPPEVFLSITPSDLYKWMSFKAYGKEDPGPNDMPTMRSHSMLYWKKAISYWMPNQQEWTILANGEGVGNQECNRISKYSIRKVGIDQANCSGNAEPD